MQVSLMLIFVIIFLGIIYFILTYKKPLYGLYVQIFLFPVSMMSQARFGFNVKIFHFALPIFLLGYLTHCVVHNKKIISSSRLDLPVLTCMLVVILSLFQSLYLTADFFVLRGAFVNYPFVRGITRFFSLCLLVLFSYIVREIISVNGIKQVVRVHLISATSISIMGIIVYLFTLFGAGWPIRAGLVFYSGVLINRLQLFFNEPLMLGNYLLSSLPFLFYFIISKNELFSKPLASIMFATQILALFLTFARSAWFGVLVALVTMIYLERNVLLGFLNLKFNNKFFVIFKYLFLSLVLVFIVSIIYNLVSDAANPSDTRFFSTFTRLHAVYSAVNAFKQHPFLGVGYENFVFYGGPYIISGLAGEFKLVNLADTNNTILKILAEIGIIGLLSFLWLVISAFFVFCQGITRRKRTNLLIPIFASLIAVITQSMFVSYVYIPHVFFVFGIFLSLSEPK